MRVHESIAAFRADLDEQRREGATIGFVPTMGFLHAGHVSLMDRAVADNVTAALSIFVNPLQFGPNEDLAAYPRDLDRDLGLADAAGVQVVLAPPVHEVYPTPILTTVSVAGVSASLEGASRPGHFDGVATVVAKLFSIVGPCRAYFGEKDFQQLSVIRRMALDLNLPVEVVGCATVREADGLALSSRNVYLSGEEREQAPVVHRALREAAGLVARGERDPEVVRAAMTRHISRASLARIDYVAVVDAATFEVPDPLAGTLRLLAAVRFGRARLIDNIGVDAP